MGELVDIDGLKEEKYAHIICYPSFSPEELDKRIGEMIALSVHALEFSGESTVFNLPILGKGCFGLAVLAHTAFGKAALKIRRTDANRLGMLHEARMLRMANSVHVGPRLINFTENLLTMDFVEGLLLPKWIEDAMKVGSADRACAVLRDVMEQSWMLDQINLDHGELSRASRHIIVDRLGKAYILDFESASVNRKTSNLTSVCQYLFIQGEVAHLVRKNLDPVAVADLIKVLRAYKKDHSRREFEEILRVCNL